MTNVVLLIEIYTGLSATVSIAVANRVSTSECRYTPMLFRRNFLSVLSKCRTNPSDIPTIRKIYTFWGPIARLLTNQNKKASIRWQDSAPPNFWLLANQWAERRLVTQWRHGCRAMRWSVCNAGASNGGRSLCVQISRERSYPLPTYWYHSKGNWWRYNFAADSFYIMKLCSRILVLYCRNLYERRQI